MEMLLVLQICETKIRLRFMVGTYRILAREKEYDGVGRYVEPV